MHFCSHGIHACNSYDWLVQLNSDIKLPSCRLRSKVGCMQRPLWVVSLVAGQRATKGIRREPEIELQDTYVHDTALLYCTLVWWFDDRNKARFTRSRGTVQLRCTFVFTNSSYRSCLFNERMWQSYHEAEILVTTTIKDLLCTILVSGIKGRSLILDFYNIWRWKWLRLR